jgi:HD-like signal output (HDOD) protein
MLESNYDRLSLLFNRSYALPELPGIAMKLIEAVDSGDASANDLERIISCDPMLPVKILRLANAASFATGTECSTIKGAIMRLGQRGVRALAMSVLMQKLTSGRSMVGIDPQKIATHSMFVGFLARYLYARRYQRAAFSSRWTADEIFSAGLLHDLGLPLLAQVAPEEFSRVRSMAERGNLTFEAAFQHLFSRPLTSLASSAASAWGLPDMFVQAFNHWERPWDHSEEFPALCCLNYANYLAIKFGATSEEWPITVAAEPEVEAEMSLAPEEAESVLELIGQQTEEYLTLSDTSVRARSA